MIWTSKKYWVVIIIAITLSAAIKFSPDSPSSVVATSAPVDAGFSPSLPSARTSTQTLRESIAGADVAFEDLTVIRKAAHRNHCYGDNFYLLLAIRKAENGGAGREFGIENARCDAIMKKRPSDTLEIQAGWAAASIIKTHSRYIDDGGDGVINDEFIEYMANRYCPPVADGRNHENWKRNVKFWYGKLKANFSADFRGFDGLTRILKAGKSK